MSPATQQQPIRDQKGCGDKVISVTVIEKFSGSSLSSSGPKRKFSRGDICQTLNNIRQYLNDNAKSPPNKAKIPRSTKKIPTSSAEIRRGGKREQEIPIKISQVGFTSSTSESTLRGKFSSPWILDTPKCTPTPPPAQKPRVKARLKEKFPSSSNVSTTSSSEDSSSSNVLMGRTKSETCHRNTSAATSKRPEPSFSFQSIVVSQPRMKPKTTAIDRFQKFLEVMKQPYARSGVQITVKPAISPKVLAEIQACFERKYPGTFPCLEKHSEMSKDISKEECQPKPDPAAKPTSPAPRAVSAQENGCLLIPDDAYMHPLHAYQASSTISRGNPEVQGVSSTRNFAGGDNVSCPLQFYSTNPDPENLFWH